MILFWLMTDPLIIPGKPFARRLKKHLTDIFLESILPRTLDSMRRLWLDLEGQMGTTLSVLMMMARHLLTRYSNS